MPVERQVMIAKSSSENGMIEHRLKDDTMRRHHRLRRGRRNARSRTDAPRHQGSPAGSRRAPIARNVSQDPGEAFGQLTWLDPRTQSGNWSVAATSRRCRRGTAKTVGGTTVHWTGSTPRLQLWELPRARTYGILPGASLIDWPIAYEELEKY